MLGGSMRKEYFASYAEYFVKFLQGYFADGVKINAVTIQNEVDTDQNGRMPAALWGQEHEIEFVKKFLGPAFEKASLDTRIWILDHNYNLWGRAIDELSDPDVNKYVDGIAWHGYYGTPDANIEDTLYPAFYGIPNSFLTNYYQGGGGESPSAGGAFGQGPGNRSIQLGGKIIF